MRLSVTLNIVPFSVLFAQIAALMRPIRIVSAGFCFAIFSSSIVKGFRSFIHGTLMDNETLMEVRPRERIRLRRALKDAKACKPQVPYLWHGLAFWPDVGFARGEGKARPASV